MIRACIGLGKPSIGDTELVDIHVYFSAYIYTRINYCIRPVWLPWGATGPQGTVKAHVRLSGGFLDLAGDCLNSPK